MKTAIVTGAGGFIGSALVEKLLSSGVAVYALDRNIDSMRQNKMLAGAKLICADFDNEFSLKECIAEKIDVFFHCAFAGGFGGEAIKNYELQLLNAKYACDAVQQAISLSCDKFVLASTVNSIEIKSFINDEHFVPRNTCIYGAGKMVAEIMGKTIARGSQMQFCTALIAMPYGERNLAGTLPNVIIKQLLNGDKPKLIEGNNLYDLIYIADVAAGLQAIGEAGVDFRNYYVGHRQLDSFKNIITKIRDNLAPNIELGFGEYPDAPAVDYSLIDLEALYRDTGFECQADFRESILKTAEWLKEHMKQE